MQILTYTWLNWSMLDIDLSARTALSPGEIFWPIFHQKSNQFIYLNFSIKPLKFYGFG